ncbi:MAG: four helix bundle protein [Anaerolineae bacterium]|jgi:four helix bundle protein|nr:four helix bundle protein [Chloroflexota bacterium]MBT7072894.1 four helix bundle protein [Anaerolineae bacterium]
MDQIRSFRDLEVWQRAHQLVLAVYRMTKDFPSDERYGLVSQMRRAAVSVPANIAEGFKRRGKGEKVRFYNIGEASLEELKYFFILSKDLGYIDDNGQVMDEAEIISKMFYRLIEAINKSR